MNAGRKWPPHADARQHKAGQHPTQSSRPGVLQPKAAATQVKKTPTAPPAYRPQPTPKVLQTKMSAVQNPPAARNTPAAPPVYRPEPRKVVQPKMTARGAQTSPTARTPQAATGVLQRKSLQPVVPARAQHNGTPTQGRQVSARDVPRAGQQQGARHALTPAGAGTAAASNVSRARPAVIPQARPGVVQRKGKGTTRWRQEQATFLMGTTKTLFDATKADDGSLMEVQSAIFDDRMFIASNYSGGAVDDTLRGKMAGSYAHGDVDYTGKKLVTLVNDLHAEQQILNELAKVLRNTAKKNPPHVTIVGTKRPCSVCRRVLLAFNKALLKHYPEVHLHFVDQTGKDTAVSALSLGALKVPTNPLFNEFVDTYTAELEKYIGKRLPGEEVSNGTRTAATPTLDDIL